MKVALASPQSYTRAISSRLPCVELLKRRLPSGLRRGCICKLWILQGCPDPLILEKSAKWEVC
jgi:hypothetical protein